MELYISLSRKLRSLLTLFCLVILLLIITSSFFLRFQYIPKTIYIIPQNQSFLTVKPIFINISKQTITPSKTVSRRCIVSINRCHGRLGNRMFSIATTYALARHHSCHLYISPFILNEMRSVFVFDLQSMLISLSLFKSIIRNNSNPMKKITKYVGCQYFPELISPNAIPSGTIFEVRGYWQSYLHFAKYGDELRQQIFVASQPILEKVSKFFINLYQQKLGFKPQFSLENHQSFKKQLAQSNKTTWIGVHVRRSDFLVYGYASSDEYLSNAIEYYTIRYSNAHFIVASDDKSYCKKLFHNRSNIFLTPSSFSEGDDFITLSLCQHSVITGGTFGWWSGYLASGEVVHDTVYVTTCENDEHYYPPWFKTDNDIVIYKHTL